MSVGLLKLSPGMPAPAALADRLRLAAHRHGNAAVGREFEDHVRSAIDNPDVVLRVDLDGLGEQERIDALADLAHELAVTVELEQARAAVREDARASRGGICAGASVHEDVALRGGGDPGDLAQIHAVGELQEIGGFVREVLREQRRGEEQGEDSHCRPPFVFGCRLSFCTRQAVISETSNSFSLRQSISWTVPNSPNCLPGLPNFPRIVPSSSIL
jgi:hypothetical protein